MLPLLALLLLPMFMGTVSAESCSEKLQEVGIAPEYTDNIPQGDLKVLYEVNLIGSYEVKCGNNLPALATTNAPQVIYDVEGKCENVSIIFIDFDVPAINNLFLHWFVRNIPASVMKNGYKGQAGDELATYFSPVGATGDHRYTICVYCQEKYIRGGRTYEIPLFRIGINPKDLAQENNLHPPEACNFYYLTAV